MKYSFIFVFVNITYRFIKTKDLPNYVEVSFDTTDS